MSTSQISSNHVMRNSISLVVSGVQKKSTHTHTHKNTTIHSSKWQKQKKSESIEKGCKPTKTDIYFWQDYKLELLGKLFGDIY